MPTPNQLVVRYAVESEMSNFFTDYMGIFNVRAYGVTPGTTTPQTTNIDACITAAKAAGSQFIYFPPGTYMTTTLADSTTLTFMGDGATFSTQGSWYNIYELFQPAEIDLRKQVNNLETLTWAGV